MTHPPPPTSDAAPYAGSVPEVHAIDRDLGLGRVVAQEARGRFLMRDGRYNARKFGLGTQRGERLYLAALNASWATFFTWLVGLALLVTGTFALAYRSLGPSAIDGAQALGLEDPFLRALVFSVGIFTTVGSGGMHAVGSTAHLLVIVQSLLGPLCAIVAAGLMIARLTRPRALIRFSESAVVAPYEQGRGFMFRMVNALPSELSNVRVSVSLSWWDVFDGVRERDFRSLELEREAVAFFPLHWTVVHPIDESSPLRGITPELLREREAEFLILVTAHEETFNTEVSLRASYTWDEVAWDAKFANVFTSAPDGVVTIDVERLSRLDRLDEGATRQPAPAERRATLAH